MRNVATYCVGVLCTVAIMHPAVAAEIPATPKRERVAERPAPQRPAPRPAPTQGANWTGGQLGGSNGVSSVNNSFVDPGSFICPFGSTFNSNCFETPFNFSGHKTVYTIGPFIGYRVQLGNWVVGLEGDWSYKHQPTTTSLNQDSSTSISVTNSNYLRTDAFSGAVKQEWDSSIRGRIGWLVTPSSLFYITGGVAFGEISGSFGYTGNLFSCGSSASPVSGPCASSSSLVATGATVVTWSDTRVGSTVGAGWESELFAGLKWRAEYRWTDFGDYTKNFSFATGCAGSSPSPASSCTSSPSSSVSINLKESFHTFRVGLAVDLDSLGKWPLLGSP
jgi:outer membrane immunogenic protein